MGVTALDDGARDNDEWARDGDVGDCEDTVAQLRSAHARMLRERHTLARLATVLHGLPNPEAVLNLATGTIATALDARRAAAFLYSPGAAGAIDVSTYNMPSSTFAGLLPLPAANFALEREALERGRSVARLGIAAGDTRLGYAVAGPFAVAPLRRDRETLGCVYLSRNPAQASFTPENIAFLDDITDCVSAALDVSRLLVHERRRSEEAEALTAVASSAAGQTLTAVTGWALTMATWTLPCDLAFVALGAEKEAELHVVSARGDLADQFLGKRLSLNESCNGVVFRTQRPLLVDAKAPDRYANLLQVGTHRFASGMAVPLTAAGEPLGTLCMARNGSPCFTTSDLSLLEELSGQLVAAIQNALQFEAEQRRRVGAEALATIASSFSVGLPANAMLEILARQALRALDVNRCAVWLVDRPAGNLTLAASSGFSTSELATIEALQQDERARRAADEVLGGRRIIAVSEASGVPGPVAEIVLEHGIHSYIAAPIPGQPEPLGILYAGRGKNTRAWHADDLRLAEALASQASAVLVNAQLYAKEQQRAARETTLRVVARELSSELGLDGFRSVLSRNLEQLTGLKNYRVTMWNETDGALETCLLVRDGEPIHNDTTIDATSAVARHLIDTGQPLLLDDLAADAARLGLTIPEEASRRPSRALLGLPLTAGGRVIGSLIVCSQDGPIPPDTVSTLETLSGQIATALENVRLYADAERHRDEERAFNAIARDLGGSLGQGSLLERIAKYARDLLAANLAEILLYDADRDVLVPRAIDGVDAEQFVRRPIDPGEGLVGQIWNTGRPISVHNYFSDDTIQHSNQLDTLVRDAGIVSLIGVPVALADERLGVLVVGSTTSRRFVSRDEDVLLRLAALAAIAVRNARLYDSARERAKRLEMLNEIGRELSSELELERFVEIAWRQITRLMDVKDCWIALATEESDELDYSLFVADGVRRPEWEHVSGPGLGRVLIDTGKTIRADDYIVACAQHGLPPRGPLAHLTKMAWLGVPLISDGKTVGALAVWRHGQPFSNEDAATLETLMEQMAPALDNTLQFQKAHELANRDPLTGLLNHRAQQDRLNEELIRAGRHQHPLAVIMLDLDNFKVFNDTYGHPGGDKILRAVADILTFEARGSDSVGRYGGDEFMLVLPETSSEGALALIERVQSRLAVLHRELGFTDAVPLSTSAGLAVFPTDAVRREELVALADAALYVSKRGGGRPVVVNENDARRAPGKTGKSGFEVLAELVRAIDAKDGYTQHHSEIVAEVALLIAEALGLSPDQHEALRVAGLLHDVGMIGVPPDVLRKVAPLSETEWKQLREHILCGELLVRGAPDLTSSIGPVIHHHERWDGRGYPRGLAGDAVPLLGRIMSVAEAYAAMVQDRPRGHRLTSEEVIAQLRGGANTQFDPQLVAILTAAIERGDLPHTAKRAATA